MIRAAAGICSLLLCIQVLGQPASVIDSLIANIKAHPQGDTMRVRAIYQYLRTTIYNTANHKPYLEEMLTLSRKLDYRFGERKALLMHVKYYGDRTDFQRSFAYGDSLLVLLENDSSYFARRDRGVLYWDLGNNYLRIGDYEQSSRYYFSAVDVFEKSGDQNFLSSLYSNIAIIYGKTGDTLRSMEYSSKSLAAAEASTDEDVRCRAMINYIDAVLDRRQFKKAVEVLDELHPLIVKLENSAYSDYYYYCRGIVSRYTNDCPTAVSFYRKSIGFARVSDDLYRVSNVMMELFHCLNEMNNFSEAKLYLDSTLAITIKVGIKSRRKEVYDGLAKWYEGRGDFRNANYYLKRSVALNDSILSEEKNREIASLETRYRVEAKESEIKTLKAEQEVQQLSLRQKSIFNYVLIGASITILIIFLLTYKNYKHKQRLQSQRITELETEKRLAATEAVLRGEEQERTRLAKDLHDGLGGMLSGIKYSFNNMKGNLIMTPENQRAFERSMDMLDSSIQEMRRVAHNMMPEALVTFGLNTALKDYCTDINKSGALKVSYQSIGIEGETIDPTASITIYRIVQELITNTMKHASAQNAIVQVSKTNGILSVTIEDDGKGFDTGILKQVKGIGWANIHHRVEFLKGKLDVSSEPGKGTSVHIEFSV